MKYYFLLSLAFLFSCQSKKVDDVSNNTPAKANIELIENNSQYLPLDSMTTPYIAQAVIYESDSVDFLIFFNSNNYKFYFYNLRNNELTETVQFTKEGPNGLGSRIASFIISEDKFFIHSYYSHQIITADFNGQVLDRLDIDTETEKIYPNTSRSMPLIKIKNAFFLFSGQPCNTINLDEKKVFLKVSKAEQNLLASYPDLYKLESDDDYWPSGFCDIAFTQGPDNQIFFGFPLDPNIYSLSDREANIIKHPFMFEDNLGINTIPDSKKNFVQDPRTENTKIFSRVRFSSLYYDKYRKVFIRRIDYPIIKKADGSMSSSSSSRLQFMNEKLNHLGYAEIKGTDHLLFTDKGMHQLIFSTAIEDSVKIKNYEYKF